MGLLWLADMLSDMYVTSKYCKQKMYVFALLMILIWLGSGCVAFGHRYVSWKRCGIEANSKYWGEGLNDRGEPKPGFKSFALYVAQIQPVIMAWDGWLHGMTRHLREEKMLAALAEGAPSSLLQLYAMMLEPPQENLSDLLILCGSIAMSILTVAVGINNAYELCVPESHKLEKNILPPGALLCFRWCDSFSRIGAWALLGMCLRPIGAKLHGIQQPYLPLILAAELLLIVAVFKSRSFGLNLACSELFKKEFVVSVMASFLGTYWCCNTADLAAQHRLSRSLLALRLLQTLGTLWLCAWSFSIAVGSECLAVEQPAVVMVALLVLFTFALAFLTALAHDVAMSLFALPFFPVIAGWKGGRLELAARLGVASQIPRLLRSAGGDVDGAAALCQAAEAGQNSAIHALVDAGVSLIAKVDNREYTAAILAAEHGHLEVVKYLHSARCDFNTAANSGYTAGIWAAKNGHLQVVQYLHSARCDFNRTANSGYNAGILAASNGHLEVAQYLHSARCDFNKAASNGYTAGILAASNGHLEVVQYLHSVRCDFKRVANNGFTAASLAAKNGHLRVLQFLRSSGCDFGVHSLHAATDSGHLSVVEFLLSFVDVNAAGIGRAHALDIARANDPNGPVAKALLRAGAAPGPDPRLVGLTALRPLETPPHGYVWLTCGAAKLAQCRGKFYHEMQILSEFRRPQLGWLSTDFEGGDDKDDKGVGDDANGWAFDGQRCCCWHGGRREPLQIAPWKVNGVLGFAIDLDGGQMQLRTEQQELTMPFKAHGAVYPAASIKGFFRMHLAEDSWKLQPPREYKEWGRGGFSWSD
ncbi:unnamed protein product [Cladocopium goreaui]|uniref:Ankyrin repeat domain-containing protein 17 n=1 Tax=Cladocopium goreaui TaxID=2562237 RepID=A0A9P1CTV3_9DINO|nr:unnamed protein product [Cladocopium goreaui]